MEHFQRVCRMFLLSLRTRRPTKGIDEGDKVLAILDALSSRLERMETRQIRLDENERMRGAIESSRFEPALGANLGTSLMRLEALEHSERKPPARAPLVRALTPSQEYSPFQ